MTAGEEGAMIIDRLFKIVDGLPIRKRKKDQINNWLWKLYTCLDI